MIKYLEKGRQGEIEEQNKIVETNINMVVLNLKKKIHKYSKYEQAKHSKQKGESDKLHEKERLYYFLQEINLRNKGTDRLKAK